MSSFFRKLRWLTQRNRMEAELREELQLHLGEEAEERQALGLAEDQRKSGSACHPCPVHERSASRRRCRRTAVGWASRSTAP